MTNVLVNGGAGYIGAHACKALAAAGHRPIAFDNLVYGRQDAVRWGPFERGDILDRPRLDSSFNDYDCAAVIHFAAFTYVGESVDGPARYYRNNVVGALTLLEATRDHGVELMVFSSSCATYGIPEQLPIAKTAPLRPIKPYGMTKLVVERTLNDFHAAHGIASISLRYFNAAGADAQVEAGERHDPETHLVPLAIEAAAGRGPELIVFGDDYDTPDGTCIRGYIHVTDLADAHVQALARLDRDGGRCEMFNLGTGIGLSVREVIAAVAQGRRSAGAAPVRPEASRGSGDLGQRGRESGGGAGLATGAQPNLHHHPHRLGVA